MNTKYAIISERIWLGITFAALAIAIYMFYTVGMSEWPYLIMVAMAGVMYLFRRMLRKRFDKNLKSE